MCHTLIPPNSNVLPRIQLSCQINTLNGKYLRGSHSKGDIGAVKWIQSTRVWMLIWSICREISQDIYPTFIPIPQSFQYKDKLFVKCWNSNSMGARGYVKERLELTPMGPFNIEQGGVNSRPDSRRVLKWVRTDGPGFSLCAAPLESSDTGYRSGGCRSDEWAEVRGYTRPKMAEGIDSERRS